MSAPTSLLAVYTGIRCRPFFAPDRTGYSFTRRIETSRLMCMWSGKREERSSGWNRCAWKTAAVLADRKLDASKGWSWKTRPSCWWH